MSAAGFHDLRTIARALGGEVCGGQVLARGPNHSRVDRSMTVRLSPSAPDGFLAFSHAGDDWRACRDYVRERLGLRRDFVDNIHEVRPTKPAASETTLYNIQDCYRVTDAIALFRASDHPASSPVEPYFASRRLALDDLAGRVIRWNGRIGAMLALFCNIATGEPQAVSRTFLDAHGRKLERKFLGPVGGAAIMLDGFDAVTCGLHIGEGVETCQSARQLGLLPTWALGSAGAVAAFPVLEGLECLTILAEHDAASERAVQACGSRWSDAGREVIVNRPIGGKDLNDAIVGAG